MKRFFLLGIIFSFCKVFSQQCPPSGSHPSYDQYPVGEVRDVQSRIEIYKKKKNRILSTDPGVKFTDSIKYSACGFLHVLNKFDNNNPKDYTGLRVYMGLNTANELVLFFVPTKGTFLDQNDPDDPAGYMEIIGNTSVSVQKSDVITAVDRYKNFHCTLFTKDGKKYRSEQSLSKPDSFRETEALWYNVDQITKIETGSTSTVHVTGLLEYMKNLLRKGSVDSIIVHVGAFLPTEEYNYQIDLVYSCFKESKGETFFFGGGENFPASKKKITEVKKALYKYKEMSMVDKSGKLKTIKLGNTRAYNFFLDDGGSFNTGIPCPPKPEGCTTCSCN